MELESRGCTVCDRTKHLRWAAKVPLYFCIACIWTLLTQETLLAVGALNLFGTSPTFTKSDWQNPRKPWKLWIVKIIQVEQGRFKSHNVHGSANSACSKAVRTLTLQSRRDKTVSTKRNGSRRAPHPLRFSSCPSFASAPRSAPGQRMIEWRLIRHLLLTSGNLHFRPATAEPICPIYLSIIWIPEKQTHMRAGRPSISLPSTSHSA